MTMNVSEAIAQTADGGRNASAAMAQTVALLAGLLAVAAALTGALGYVALNVLPCSLFGSAHEGACGYGATSFMWIVGPFVSIAVYVGLLVLTFNRATKSQDAAALCLRWLRAAFGLTVLSVLVAVAGWVPSPFDSLLLTPVTAGFCATVFFAARKVHRFPWLWALATYFADSFIAIPFTSIPSMPLLVLIAISYLPLVGVFIYLQQRLKSAASASAT